MKSTKFLSAVLAIAAGLSMASTVVAGVVTPTPILNAYYDPATGNIKLQNTTSGSQSFLSFNVITLGNGSLGALSGQPSNQGFLSTGTFNMPLPPASFETPPTSLAGINGIYSQIAAANLGSNPIFSLAGYPGWSETPGNQIGPVGSYWDLGNLAIPGMNQAQLDARFLTDPEATGGTEVYGQFNFLYLVGSTPNSTVGGVIAVAPIPEPSTIALAAVAATIGGVGAVSKRRKKARLAAKRLSINA